MKEWNENIFLDSLTKALPWMRKLRDFASKFEVGSRVVRFMKSLAFSGMYIENRESRSACEGTRSKLGRVLPEPNGNKFAELALLLRDSEDTDSFICVIFSVVEVQYQFNFCFTKLQFTIHSKKQKQSSEKGTLMYSLNVQAKEVGNLNILQSNKRTQVSSKQFFDALALKFNIKNPSGMHNNSLNIEDWGTITKRRIADEGGLTFIQKNQGSVLKTLKNTYPGIIQFKYYFKNKLGKLNGFKI